MVTLPCTVVLLTKTELSNSNSSSPMPSFLFPLKVRIKTTMTGFPGKYQTRNDITSPRPQLGYCSYYNTHGHPSLMTSFDGKLTYALTFNTKLSVQGKTSRIYKGNRHQRIYIKLIKTLGNRSNWKQKNPIKQNHKILHHSKEYLACHSKQVTIHVVSSCHQYGTINPCPTSSIFSISINDQSSKSTSRSKIFPFCLPFS